MNGLKYVLISSIIFSSLTFNFSNIGLYDDKYFELNDTECNENLYNDVLISYLMKDISNIVRSHYNQEVSIDTTSLTILKIQRPFPDSSTIFDMLIKVNPFIGPHNTIGEDTLIIRISPSDSAFELIDYNHVYGGVGN